MLPLMPSLTPLRYPMPYPTTQAATVQPATRSQVSPLGIVNAQWMVARGPGSPIPEARTPMPLAHPVPPKFTMRTVWAVVRPKLERQCGAKLEVVVVLRARSRRLCRDGRQGYQAGECRHDDAHFSLRDVEAVCSEIVYTTQSGSKIRRSR